MFSGPGFCVELSAVDVAGWLAELEAISSFWLRSPVALEASDWAAFF
jgi:hypothetical protein